MKKNKVTFEEEKRISEIMKKNTKLEIAQLYILSTQNYSILNNILHKKRSDYVKLMNGQQKIKKEMIRIVAKVKWATHREKSMLVQAIISTIDLEFTINCNYSDPENLPF